jgi:phospholipid transport system substrate-binding protein
MYSLIKNRVSFVLLIASLTTPLIVSAADDNKIQEKIYKLNERILNIVGSTGKIDVEAKKKLYALADKSKLFDWDVMTCHVISDKYYQMASPEQKMLLTENLKKLFIYTYSGLLAGKQGKGPIFSSFRNRDLLQNQCGYEISGVLQADFEKDEPNAEAVVYLLSKSKTPEVWRLVDIKAMGIDFLENYNTQFKDEIRNNGLNSLIEKLQAKNSR